MIKKQEKKTAICEIPPREINALETKDSVKKPVLNQQPALQGQKEEGEGEGEKQERGYMLNIGIADVWEESQSL